MPADIGSSSPSSSSMSQSPKPFDRSKFYLHYNRLKPWLLLQNYIYHIHTLFLFTYSDLKTMVIPSTAFGLSVGIAKGISEYDINLQHYLYGLLHKVPAMLLWTWINCLAFNVHNQKSPRAVKEDILNKPWRPIPSNRIRYRHLRLLSIVIYPMSITTSFVLGGGLAQSLLLALLGFMYNDQGLGDKNAIIRNVLNACGFVSFASGASGVAEQSTVDAVIVKWSLIIGLIVFTTVHIQDMYDQIGDAAAGRRTIPLILGDDIARWTIVTPILLWSYICPSYWDVNIFGYCAVIGLGILISGRLITCRAVKSDRTTFLIYNGWLVVIYCLPVLSAYN